MRAQFEISRANYDEAGRVLARQTKRRSLASVIPIATCVLGATLYTNRDSTSSALAPGMLLALGLILGIERISSAYDAHERRWKKSAPLMGTVTLTAGDAELRLSSQRWDVAYQWVVFMRFIETANLFLLFDVTDELKQMIPKSAFSSQESLREFRKLLITRISPNVRGFPIEVTRP